MALTRCHECGSKVSTTAATCPKCGAPVVAVAGPSHRLPRWIFWATALALVIIVAGLAKSPDEKTVSRQAPDTAFARQEREEQTARTVLDKSKDAIRLMAKDGESVRFRQLTAFRQIDKAGRFSVAVCGSYNAKNSFGAYSGFDRFVSVGNVEGTIVEDGPAALAFGGVWRSMCKGTALAHTD